MYAKQNNVICAAVNDTGQISLAEHPGQIVKRRKGCINWTHSRDLPIVKMNYATYLTNFAHVERETLNYHLLNHTTVENRLQRQGTQPRNLEKSNSS